MPDFLLEIGCEEIPARMIDAASQELRERVHKLLDRERLLPAGALTYLDTPRRLAVLAANIPAAQPDVTEQVTGPSVSVAYKDGQPTPAAHAFAKKAGVDVSQLQRSHNCRRANICRRRSRRKDAPPPRFWPRLCPKRSRRSTGPRICTGASRASASCVRCAGWWRCSMPRSSRWSSTAFAPGTSRAATEFWPTAGRDSRGRVLPYVEALEQAKVLGREQREKQIRKALDAATRTIPGARWREDKSLLDTVVNLTEWPSAILGNFDPEFLELPEEVLVTVMRDHQKYFAVEDSRGKPARRIFWRC